MFRGIHENETEFCETYNFIKKTPSRPKVTLSKNEAVQRKMLALFPDPVNSFGEFIVPNPNSIPGPHQTGKGLRRITWNPKLQKSFAYNSNRKRELRRRQAKRRDRQTIQELKNKTTPARVVIQAPNTPTTPTRHDKELTKKLIETQNKLDIAESKIKTLQNTPAEVIKVVTGSGSIGKTITPAEFRADKENSKADEIETSSNVTYDENDEVLSLGLDVDAKVDDDVESYVPAEFAPKSDPSEDMSDDSVNSDKEYEEEWEKYIPS